MFEGIVSWVLNMYFGDYLENLNTDQLSVALLQGQIEIENIPFKKSALRKFNAPISLKSGVLGKLTLSIPLTRLRSEPWCITLRDIDIVLEPSNDVDIVKEEQLLDEQIKANEKLLMMDDNYDNYNNAEASAKEGQSSNWWGYNTVYNIVDNIQLCVQNVRIRYVDETTFPGRSWSCGVDIERFLLQNTDSRWNSGFVIRNAEESAYKYVQCFGLSFYCNNLAESTSRSTEMGKFLSDASFEVKLEKKIIAGDDGGVRNCYDVFTKFYNVLKLNLDQAQVENVRTTSMNISKWYFGDTDDEKIAKHKPKEVVGISGSLLNTSLSAAFEIPSTSIELRNMLVASSDEEWRPFVACLIENVILKYAKERVHVSHIDFSASSILVKDLLENLTVPPFLISTKIEKKLNDTQISFLSFSCPELSTLDDSDFVVYSSSLPGSSLTPTYPSCRLIPPFATAPTSPRPSRKTSLRLEPSVRLHIMFIDSIHKDFETLYNKVQCQITVDFEHLEIVINQQTWVFLLDFFGLLTPSDSSENNEGIKLDQDVRRQIRMQSKSLSLVLTKPKNRRILSRMKTTDFRTTIMTEKVGVEIFGKLNGLLVEDCSPSTLYTEKVNIRSSDKEIEFVIYKYSDRDDNLQREFDAVLSLTSPETCTYVHSQRFLLEFISFWTQYAQMQEYYSRAKAAMFNDNISHGFRLKLTAKLNRTIVVLPESSNSEKSLIVEMETLIVNNYFRSAASHESAKFYDDTNSFDCLQDVIEVNMNDCSVFVGKLIELNETNRNVIKETDNLFDDLTPVSVTVVRNLDSAISRNVPDMEIHSKFKSVVCRLHVETYKILRNVLEQNFGEYIPSDLTNSQVDFRQNPATVTVLSGIVWRNLLLRIDFTNVHFLCSNLNCSTTSHEIFGRAEIVRGHFSFENFSNSMTEANFVCHSGNLIDTRYDHKPANKRDNVFSSIFSAKNAEDEKHILFELHFLSHNDTTKFTLVFSMARIMAVADWLTIAKDFILVNTSDSNDVLKSHLKKYVSTRNSEQEAKKKNEQFEIRTNFSGCEIIFIEFPSNRNSLATILEGNGVINYKETNFAKYFSCQLNSLRVMNCVFQNRDDTLTALTEPFGYAIEMNPVLKKNEVDARSASVGLLDLGERHVEHRIEINVTHLVVKLSYRDWLVFKNVVDVYTSLYSRHSLTPSNSSFTVEKIETKIASACLWLLDDSQDHCMPLFRCTIMNAEFDQKPTLRSDVNDGFGSMNFSVDFFNQNVYGWEPLIEPWNLQNLGWSYSPNLKSLTLDVSCRNEVLNFNVSRIFLQQSAYFLTRFSSDVKTLISNDLRTSYVKRSEFLPYLLRNESGSRLKFTVEAAKLQNSDQKCQINNQIDWIVVEPNESASFSFNSLAKFNDDENKSGFDKIVVRIDGWHEVGSVNVDSVGTFFRLTRSVDTNKNVSGSVARNVSSCYAQVVVAVTKDNEGRKLIAIRSSLLFINALAEPLDLLLLTDAGHSFSLELLPGEVRPAPLAYSMCTISVRPKCASNFAYCKPLSWKRVTTPGQISDCFRQCAGDAKIYKFCVSAKREHFPETKRYSELHSTTNLETLPAHTLTFAPVLTIVNLLPVDLKCKIGKMDNERDVTAGGRLLITEVEDTEQLDLWFSLENFIIRDCLLLKSSEIQKNEKKFDVEIFDTKKRRLLLNAVVTPTRGGGIKISLSSPFWIVNKCGLPLIFKQDEADEEAAGQFFEHEAGKSMVPMIFSFTDSGTRRRLMLRIGRAANVECVPVWSTSFPLEAGILFKTLLLQKQDGSPSLAYNIGVEVRLGQGLYKDTQTVMLTPLYTLDNRSSYQLFVAQKCDVMKETKFHQTISPNCCMAWHWSRQDLDMLLCVRRSDMIHWANGFRIDQLTSFHLTTRDAQDLPHLLRVEIVLHGAMYFVTFLDADTFPPPIRIENLTEVPVLYQQRGCDANHLRAILRPHSEINYSWDDQLQPKLMVLTVYGNKSIEYDLTILGNHCPLTYENFFYIALSSTFDRSSAINGEEQDLVLDVLAKGKVILNKKDPNKQTQLWRMNVDGMLINVGQSKIEKENHVSGELSVLDILSCGGDPNTYVPLMLCRADDRRRLTQRWTFTNDGRLMCCLTNLYVQAADRQLKSNVAAVLGPTHSSLKYVAGVPPEQWINRQRQKPGSGSLAVNVFLDGPTRVLRIQDRSLNPDIYLSPRKMPNVGEFHFVCSFNLEALAFSLITDTYEELLYCQMRGFLFQVGRENNKYSLSAKVLEVQADNQLVSADRWTLLYVRPKYDEKGENCIPALSISVSWTPLPSYDSFESFVFNISKASLFLDEVFLWKFVLFSEFGKKEAAASNAVAPATHATPNIDVERPDPHKARRCYFGTLSLSCKRLYLSVLTANMLPMELRRVKQHWNVPLVRFENAPVEIKTFQQMYYFETLNFLLDALGKHLQQELTSQAVKILGSVDFLGNPLGLFQDLSGGLRELFIEANVSGFVRGVFHGVSNSTAKFTSSVSEGVGKIAMDEQHMQMREAIRHSQSRTVDPLGHLMTGVKGLGFGLFTGVFSVPSGIYYGAQRSGFEGMMSGAAFGVAGMVTKPLQGVFDLATGAAIAAKEIVSGSGPPTAKFPSCRLRPSRVTKNIQGTLPIYSATLALGQETLRSISNNINEICLAMYLINMAANGETLFVLVSTEIVYVIKKRSPFEQEVVLTLKLSELVSCAAVTQRNAESHEVPYLEFLSNSVSTNKSPSSKPKKSLVKCNSIEVAVELSKKIFYAKQQFDDQQRRLVIPEDISVEL